MKLKCGSCTESPTHKSKPDRPKKTSTCTLNVIHREVETIPHTTAWEIKENNQLLLANVSERAVHQCLHQTIGYKQCWARSKPSITPKKKKEKLGANGEESYGLIRWHLVWQAAVEATSIVYLGVTCLIHATQRLNSLTPWWCGVASATMVLRSWLSYQNTLVWIKIITWSSSVIIYPTQLNNAGLNSLWRMELLAILFLT